MRFFWVKTNFPEELRLNGELQVEDWPYARQVERPSVKLFEATQPLYELDERALHLLERATLSEASRARVSALAALLLIVDALDWSHEGRIARLAANKELCDEHTWRISVGRRTPADLDAEWDHTSEEG